MQSSAPSNYICPICLGNEGIENSDTMLKQADQVFADDQVIVWINSLWVGKNFGHVIVVPRDHYENLYDLPKSVGHRIFEVSQMMARALKEVYGCDGITLRQNNEPAGDQHAFHYHLHVFPRYENDGFNEAVVAGSTLVDPEKRSQYAEKLRIYLQNMKK